jgi:hypothetical protein
LRSFIPKPTNAIRPNNQAGSTALDSAWNWRGRCREGIVLSVKFGELRDPQGGDILPLVGARYPEPAMRHLDSERS